MPFDFPQMESKTRTDLLWTDVWRIVEQLRLLEETVKKLEEQLNG